MFITLCYDRFNIYLYLKCNDKIKQKLVLKNSQEENKMKQKVFFSLMSVMLLITITIITSCNEDRNNPPRIMKITPASRNTIAGSIIKFTCIATDENESLLTYNWSSNCGTFLNGTTKKAVDWQAPEKAGSCDVTITVNDGKESAEYTFTVTVEEKKEVPPTTVGVYYYPWHGGADFHGRKYLREHLDPVQIPQLGEYNDRDSKIIKQHLEWCEYAGIGLWVSSWWGPGKMTDITLKNYIMKHNDLKEMKIALFYETTGRMPNFTDASNVESDIKYMAENYFDHPNYFKIDGKPVLFIYLTRVLSREGILEKTLNTMRNTARQAGFEIYIVGDQVFGQPPSSTKHIDLLDAITNYDVYGSSGGKMYATQEKVNNYYKAQAGWRSKAHQVGTSFIPASAPGYNDTGVREGHIPLSRKLSESDEFGSLFKAMVNEAVKITDPETGNLFMVTSWNEWHEDTQIEPVAVAPATSKDDSSTKDKYTAGMEYEGYGMRYLDILKEVVNR